MRTASFLGVVVVSSTIAQSSSGQVFRGIGIEPGTNRSSSQAISEDGQTVVGGTSDGFVGTSFRWTLNGGRQMIDIAPTGYTSSGATDVSANGSVIVGIMSGGGGSGTRVWQWSASSGAQEVPGLLTTNATTRVSADGLTVLGSARDISGTNFAARWSAATGVVVAPSLLSGLPAGRSGFPSAAGGLSSNGAIVVGAGRVGLVSPEFINVAFSWSGTTAMALLQGDDFFGVPPSGANPTDVSADGTVIIGNAGFSFFRWTAASGYTILGSSTAAGGSAARVSGDGNAAVLSSLYWTQSTGTLPLATVLTNAGCSFPGWSNLVATDLSFDGRALCGYGVNPQGMTEAWYATVPGPGACGLFVVGVVFATRRRR